MKVLVAPHNATGPGSRHSVDWGDGVAMELLCFIWAKSLSRRQHVGNNETVLTVVCHPGYATNCLDWFCLLRKSSLHFHPFCSQIPATEGGGQISNLGNYCNQS